MKTLARAFLLVGLLTACSTRDTEPPEESSSAFIHWPLTQGMHYALDVTSRFHCTSVGTDPCPSAVRVSYINAIGIGLSTTCVRYTPDHSDDGNAEMKVTTWYRGPAQDSIGTEPHSIRVTVSRPSDVSDQPRPDDCGFSRGTTVVDVTIPYDRDNEEQAFVEEGTAWSSLYASYVDVDGTSKPVRSDIKPKNLDFDFKGMVEMSDRAAPDTESAKRK